MAASTRESASNEGATDPAGCCPPGTAEEDEELLRRWFQVYTGMQSLSTELLAEVERSAGLTAPELRVLRYLAAVDATAASASASASASTAETGGGGGGADGAGAPAGAPMNEITRLLGFSTAGTTKLIDRLCATGLVERNTDPADRRVVLAALTPAGASAANRAARVLAAALRERFLARLGEDRVSALVEAFAVLSDDSGTC